MNRRGFLAGVIAAPWVGQRVGQDTAQAVGAADPLRDPSVAGNLRAVTTTLDNDEAIKTVERRLKCTCGCNLDIFTCRTTDFTCTYSPALHQEVVALHGEGKSAEEIVEAFVAKYGEAVLLAPKAQGFNVVGYLLPGTLVLLAAATVSVVLLRRHRNRLMAVAPAATRPSTVETALSTEQQERLAEALREIEP